MVHVTWGTRVNGGMAGVSVGVIAQLEPPAGGEDGCHEQALERSG